MTKHYKYSRSLHWVTLCCFLFPFFYTGCGPSAEEKLAMEKTKQDSISADSIQQGGIYTKSVDTIIQKNITQVNTSKEQGQSLSLQVDNPPSSGKTTITLSQNISNKNSFLRSLLIPKADTYTGIATVMDIIPYTSFLAIFISLLFLIISLVVKFIDKGAKKAIVLLDFIALIFLCISEPFSLGSEKLWGFWVAVTFTLALTIYDLYITKQPLDN